MSFDIFVVASGGCGHRRSGIPYGDEWELSWVSRQLLGRVGVRHRSATGGATAFAMTAAGRIALLHNLVDTIDQVMANHSNGPLNVYIRHEHTLRPDTSVFATFRLAAGSTPGGRIARDLCAFLDRNGMNRWGVLIEILDALTRFDLSYTGHGYIINISLYD